jgi:hypothetical protein
MADDSAPMPGPNEFSAAQETAMRANRRAQNQWSVTPKGQAAYAAASGQWRTTPKGSAALAGATPAPYEE